MAMTAQQVFMAIIRADATGAVTELKKVNGEVQRTTAGAQTSFGKLSTFAKSAMAGIGAAAVLEIGSRAVSAASDLEESINAVNVTFGDAAGGIRKLGEDAADAVGLSNAEFNGIAVQFSSFADTVAGEGGDVVGVVDEMTTRMADFASVMNLDVAEAARLFQSGLAGETEPLRRYGLDLSAATVEAHAYSAGIAESGAKLTEQQKILSRYSLLMKQTSKTAGDFKNTQDSLANQQRTLNANMTDLSAALAKGVVPALARASGGALTFARALQEVDDKTPGWLKDLTSKGQGINVRPFLSDLFGKIGDFTEPLPLTDDVFNAVSDALAESADKGVNRFAQAYGEEIADMERQMDTAIRNFGTDVGQANGDAIAEMERAMDQAVADFGVVDFVTPMEEAAAEWAQAINDAATDGANSFQSFTDEAMGSAARFRDELNLNNTKTRDWQTDLLVIASQTAPEFAAHLASMGEAGFNLVDDLADPSNVQILDEAFWYWVDSVKRTDEDMAAAFRKAGKNLGGAIEDIGGDLQLDLEKAVSGAGEMAEGEAIATGRLIAAGIASGMDANNAVIAAAAGRAVMAAYNAAQKEAKIESPSRLFAEGVGQPIAEGIEEGIVEDADRIADALERAIDSAAKEALKAVDRLVDEANDKFDGAWDMIGARRNKEDLQERVTDANANLRKVLADPESTPEEIADAYKRVEDANYNLLRASEDLLDQGARGEAQFRAIATAAGLEKDEIDALVASYRELQEAKKDAAVETAAIQAEADQAQATRREFATLARAGFFSADELNHLAQFSDDPAYQLWYMQQLIDRANAFIDGLPKFHSGGIVPGPAGAEVPIMAKAGEYVGWPGQGGGGGANVYHLSFSVAPGTDQVALGNYLIRAINVASKSGAPRLVAT